MSLSPGSRVGPYEIVSLIGTGGMGEVYRARDTKLNRDVAIKTIRDDFTGPDRIGRFHREAQILAGLNHSNIGVIYGMEEVPIAAGSDRPLRALVLEFVDGQTLADRIGQGPMPLDDTLAIARQVADAVAAAHDQGIIHRDLKPANIKLRPDGTVKVLDFGLAKVFGDDSASGESFNSPTISLGATRAGVILGTAAYMSPEQARGKAVDKRTDVWAFGCVLYEMLSGRRAFGGDEVSDTLAFVITKDIDWTVLPTNTPAAVGRVLRRCLEKDRSLRLRDIGDAALELRDPQSSLESPVVTAARPTARSRFALGIAGGIVAGAAIVGAAIWLTRPTPRPSAVRRFAVSLPTSVSAGPGIVTRNVVIAPDATRLAYVGRDGRLLIRPFDSFDAVPVVESGVASTPFFSPDGRSVGFFIAGTGEVKRAAVTGGPPLSVTRAVGGSRGATWAPDGSIILATTDTASGLLIAPSAGGAARILTKPDNAAGETDHAWPEILPGGRAVLFTITKPGGLQNAEIAAFDLKAGAKKVLLRGGSHAQYIPTGHLIYVSTGGVLNAVAFDAERLEVLGDPVPVPIRVATSNAGAVNASVSADGTLVYVSGGAGTAGERRLVWVDRQGREEAIDADPAPYAVPRVSPDGGRVAVHVDTDLADVAVFNIARRSLVRLTFGNVQSIRPGWSPDGRWVFFRSDIDGRPGIYRKASDGGGAIEWITAVAGDGSIHSFTPDGKSVVYAQVDPKTARDLWMIDVDGKQKPQPLVVEPGDQANAVVSPDGRWIAYHASEIGEIYVRPFPNVDAGRWQLVPSGAKWPVWSRDGRELYYVTTRGGITAMGIETKETPQWSSPKLLFDTTYVGFQGLAGPRNYDLSPDGRRFLVIKEGAAAQPSSELIVVEHWIEELKRLLPTK